jgi:hypothetical protein
LSRQESTSPALREPTPEVRTIRLASELPEPPPTQACLSFGTFDDAQAASRASAEVAARGLEPLVKEEVAPALDGYLVYIETDGSRAVARRIAQELRSRAIECQIIPTGQLADSLSVGVFHRREFADAHLKRLEKLGYEADLQALTKSKLLYRVLAPSDACDV